MKRLNETFMFVISVPILMMMIGMLLFEHHRLSIEFARGVIYSNFVAATAIGFIWGASAAVIGALSWARKRRLASSSIWNRSPYNYS